MHMLSPLNFYFWLLSSESQALRAVLGVKGLGLWQIPQSHPTHRTAAESAVQSQNQALFSPLWFPQPLSCDQDSWWGQVQPQGEFRTTAGVEHGQTSLCCLNPTRLTELLKMKRGKSLRKG